MVKYPYQAFYSTKMYMLISSRYYGYNGVIYFKGVEYIQRAWRKILSQRKEIIKDYFKDQVARELMAYCYHPSRLSFQI